MGWTEALAGGVAEKAQGWESAPWVLTPALLLSGFLARAKSISKMRRDSRKKKDRQKLCQDWNCRRRKERRCSRQRNSVSWEERRTSLFCMSHHIHPLAWGGHVSYGDRGLTPGLCPVPRQRGVEVSWPGWAVIRLTQGLCPSWGWISEQDGTTETFMPRCTLLEDQTLLR